jgi:hypothetical protein
MYVATPSEQGTLFAVMSGPGACPLTRTALREYSTWHPKVNNAGRTYCRVKPSGEISPFVKVRSAVGPIAARAVEIKHVATKKGEKAIIVEEEDSGY